MIQWSQQDESAQSIAGKAPLPNGCQFEVNIHYEEFISVEPGWRISWMLRQPDERLVWGGATRGYKTRDDALRMAEIVLLGEIDRAH